MQKALTFFRVFDLAFFAPGTILLVVGCLLLGDPSTLSATLGPAQITIAILGFVAAAFCGGLVIHSIVWRIKCGVEWILAKMRGGSDSEGKPDCDSECPSNLKPKEEGWIPLPMWFEGDAQTDLILYFWYLRATCWNVACALFIVLASTLMIKLPQEFQEHLTGIVMVLVLAILALIYQGYGFHKTIHESFKILAKKIDPKEPTNARDS